VRSDGIELEVGGAEPTRVLCRAVVNAAGLDAQRVARSIAGVPPETVPPLHLAKGHYFALRHAPPFRHLVYPVAGAGGLGTHVTLDLAGRARFGPDVEWIDRVDYAFDESRAAGFYAAIRRYYPELQDDALVAGTTGIRPKLVPRGAPAADFALHGPAEHGVPGLVSLYGIESPGLTACLALAERVAALL
jgi:L-2-hydroxyglutarate oxidase LhgO